MCNVQNFQSNCWSALTGILTLTRRCQLILRGKEHFGWIRYIPFVMLVVDDHSSLSSTMTILLLNYIWIYCCRQSSVWSLIQCALQYLPMIYELLDGPRRLQNGCCVVVGTRCMDQRDGSRLIAIDGMVNLPFVSSCSMMIYYLPREPIQLMIKTNRAS